MTPQSCDRLNYIDQYGVNMDLVNFYGGAFGRVGKSRKKNLWPQYNPMAIKKQLQCTREESHWQVIQYSRIRLIRTPDNPDNRFIRPKCSGTEQK